MRHFITLLVFSLCTLTGANAQSGGGATVLDIVVNSPDHNTLETAVLAAELDGALDGPGPLTVFAPTDAAFDALPAGTIDALLDDPSGLLTDILLYHVVGAQALSGDLSDGQMITTLNGEDVVATINGGVFINDAQVIVADLQADNGVVHVIDAVLMPPTTVWDIIVESPAHNTLETAVLAAELDGALDGPGPLTVFAPTDAAFDALPAGTIDALLDDPSGLLTDILLYHVVGAQALSGDLSDGQMITTLNGEDVVATINGGVFINDAQVIVADLQADNGVVHVIDAVLDPVYVGLEETEDFSIVLYPNPTTEWINVSISNTENNALYRVVTTTGSIVQDGGLNPGVNQVQLESLNPGTYFFTVLLNEQTRTQQLLLK